MFILLWEGVRGVLQVPHIPKGCGTSACLASAVDNSSLQTSAFLCFPKGLALCGQVSAGAGVALPGLAAASQLGRLADLQELDLQGAGTTDAFLADLATAAPRLTR